MPQISDVLLCGLILLNWQKVLGVFNRGTKLNLALRLFLVVVLLTNIVNIIFYYDIRFILSSFYFIYNISVFILFMALFEKEFHVNKLKGSLRFTIFLQLLVSIIFSAYAYRSIRLTGTFNNPNQLGYWSLLVLVFYLSLLRKERSFAVIDIFFIAILGFLLIKCLSKAAIISSIVAFIIYLLKSFKKSLNPKSISSILLLMVVIIFKPDITNTNFAQSYDRLENRIKSIGESDDDNLQGRNYDRLIVFPEKLIFGSGEGGYIRYNLRGKKNEIHSTPATLLFSYGIIGFSLFFSVLFFVCYNSPIIYSFYMIPLMMYGVTHNGMRYTLFWILLAFIAAHMTNANRRHDIQYLRKISYD